MRYIKVRWFQDIPGEPVELYSELDDRGFETRKVEVFRDGSAGFAGPDIETETTRLGIEPLPTLEEIGRDPQFDPREITEDEFERAWDAARRIGSFR